MLDFDKFMKMVEESQDDAELARSEGYAFDDMEEEYFFRKHLYDSLKSRGFLK